MVKTLFILAAVPLCWERRPNRPAPAQFDAFHGETLELRCEFEGFGALPFGAGANVRLWYQTNGMGAAWWSVPATVASNTVGAAWGPAQDPGADRVAFFFGAPSNAYAAAQVRFRNSPGATPNILEPPGVLDWVAELDALSNALALASAATFMPQSNAYTKAETDARIVELAPPADLTPATNYTDRVLSKFAETGTVAEASYAKVAEGAAFADSACGLTDGGDINLTATEIKERLDSIPGPGVKTNDVASIVANLGEHLPSGARVNFGDKTFYSEDIRADSFSGTIGWADYHDGNGDNLQSALDRKADADNVATKGELSPLQDSVNAMWATMYGENVWISITNYMRQVANTVPSLRLWEVRGAGTNLVYSSAEEIEHVVTQNLNAAKAELEGKMPRKAWGSYQSSGEDNPSPDRITVVNSPKIMLTGGGGWYKMIETGGASVWMLKSSGPLNLGGGTNGYFRVCDAEGRAQIEVVKTADQTVDAIPQDTDFDDDGNFTVTFNAGGSEHPKVSCAADLGDDFEEEDGSGNINSLGITVEWAKNGGGMWAATIHQDTPAQHLFVYGKMKLQGENLVRNNAPTSLGGGIYINNVKYRLVPYSSGGKTYLTLEEWQ